LGLVRSPLFFQGSTRGFQLLSRPLEILGRASVFALASFAQLIHVLPRPRQLPLPRFRRLTGRPLLLLHGLPCLVGRSLALLDRALELLPLVAPFLRLQLFRARDLLHRIGPGALLQLALPLDRLVQLESTTPLAHGLLDLPVDPGQLALGYVELPAGLF